MKRLTIEVKKPLFWVILFCFLAGTFLYYSEFLLLSGDSVSSLLGMERHSIERLLFLAIVMLSGIVQGVKAGFVYLALTILVMVPRLFLTTNFLSDAIFETIVVTVAGGSFNWWFKSHRHEVNQHKQTLLKLESIRQELQSHIEIIRENEKRLSVLHSINTTINELANLNDILNIIPGKIMEGVNVDGVLIFLINKSTDMLELKQYRGVSDELIRKGDRMKIGEGFNGWVAQTGKPAFIENSIQDTRLSLEVVKQEGIVSQYIVPLIAREKVVGTLCCISHSIKTFSKEEQQLLILIGSELGVALERVSLTEEKERVGQRFKELFEKAHDAIWMQDFDGKILTANEAAAEFTGYDLSEIIGANVTRFLSSDGLELARRVRRNLLSSTPIEQPYEQKVNRKDGTVATIMLTTSLTLDDGGAPLFQHISRDVTRERRLSENLRLYTQQITRAHEEERKRIARELHDDSIQALIILSRRVDELVSTQPKRARIAHTLSEVREEIDNILSRIRLFTQDLRPPTLDYLGLVPAVRELVSQAGQQAGIISDLNIYGEEHHFTPEDQLLIYRIIQESLRNVWRHAKAKEAHVSIHFDSRNTVVEIEDDGSGFVIGENLRFVKAGKIGLAGMQERADLLEGNLNIQSRPGQGTKVMLTIIHEERKK
jgi:two-component system sensor histidine kinase DegS